MQEKRVGRLIVKWNDDQPFGCPFVTVTRPGFVPVAVKEFQGQPGEENEPYVEQATAWANDNQDQANSSFGSLFG